MRSIAFRSSRYRQFPRSSSLEVGSRSRTSRNTNAFSRFGENNAPSDQPTRRNRRAGPRNRASLPGAVSVRHRRSNSRYTSSISARRVRRWGELLPIRSRVQIAWMREGKYAYMPFNQRITLPCDLTLPTLDGSPRVYRRAIR
jgi:hypothetical protein